MDSFDPPVDLVTGEDGAGPVVFCRLAPLPPA